jgi:cell division septum initiation protein DivIVA
MSSAMAITDMVQTINTQAARIAELEAERFSRDVDPAFAPLASNLAEKLALVEAERDQLRARLDRAIGAAQQHFGEDCIRYKLSLFKNGRARNFFPPEMDGNWYAFQRADNDAHIGLCDTIDQLRAEVERLREFFDADMLIGKIYDEVSPGLTSPKGAEWSDRVEAAIARRCAAVIAIEAAKESGEHE